MHKKALTNELFVKTLLCKKLHYSHLDYCLHLVYIMLIPGQKYPDRKPS